MADKKISELTTITGANTASGDLFVIVDVDANETKKITRDELTNALELTDFDNIDINGGTIDGTVIGGASAAAGTFTTLNATGGGALTGTWSNLGTVTTADINGGTIDGVTIGGASAGAGTFTTITGSGDMNIDSGTLFVDASENRVGMGTSSPAVSGVHVVRATGSASPIPVEARLQTTTNASDFSTTDPWGRLSFYSSDTSVGGAKIHAAIQTTAAIANGGASNLDFLITDRSTGVALKQMSLQPIGTGTSQTSLYTSGQERFRIDTGGNVGIGTTSPGAKLSVDGSAIFNESGADVDFRVESDTNTHALFVDAGNSRVGVNVVAPATELEVRGTTPITASRNLQITAADSGFGHYRLSARYDATNYGVGASINALSDGAWSSTSLPTKLVFYTVPSGATALQERLRLSPTEAVFNDGSYDTDFRVESDTNANMLFVDAGNNKVSIGNNAPSYMLDVSGGISALSLNGVNDGIIVRVSNSTEANKLRLSNNGSDIAFGRNIVTWPGKWDKGDDAAASGGWVISANGSTVYFQSNATDTNPLQYNRFTISAGGNVTSNESGTDSDFRVESDTNTHALFVDAGNSRVGINITPSFPLDVEGTAYFRGTTASDVIRVIEYPSAKTYIVTDSLASGGKTRLSFSGGDRRSCVIELTISGSWAASGNGSNHPAAKYIMRAFTTTSAASIDGPTALYEYIYSSASHFTFTDQGSGDYTIDITNPTGDSTVSFTYKIEILNAISSGGHSLTASSTI